MRKGLIVFALVVIVPVLACADLTIKEKTTVHGFMGMFTSEGTEITYLKGDKFRNEAEVERSGMVNPTPIEDPPPRVTIIRLDKDLIWRVNLKDKTYMETSLEAMAAEAEGRAHFKITDVKIEATGETREIAGRDCKGISTEVSFEVDSGDEVANQTMEILFWMTEDTEGLEEMQTFWQESLKLAQGQAQEYPVWDALEKMAEKEEFKGIPMGMEITMEVALGAGEKAEMQQAINEMLKARGAEEATGSGEEAAPGMKIVREVVSVSGEDLDDALFEIPEGFKQAARIRMW
jgi:hypothetical protein